MGHLVTSPKIWLLPSLTEAPSLVSSKWRTLSLPAADCCWLWWQGGHGLALCPKSAPSQWLSVYPSQLVLTRMARAVVPRLPRWGPPPTDSASCPEGGSSLVLFLVHPVHSQNIFTLRDHPAAFLLQRKGPALSDIQKGAFLVQIPWGRAWGCNCPLRMPLLLFHSNLTFLRNKYCKVMLRDWWVAL